MQAVILAGGLGTRLRPIVNDRPKPLANVNGLPFLAYLLHQVHRAGFSESILCIGYRGEMIIDTFGDEYPRGLPLKYVWEETLLGTAGAIKNAAAYLDGPFLAMNGDSFLEVDLAALTARHASNRQVDPETLGTLVLTYVPDASRFGSVVMDAGFRVRKFAEKQIIALPGWINGGIYFFEPEVLDAIPAGKPVSIERETFPALLEAGHHLYGYPVRGYFMDIGTPEGYLMFQTWASEHLPAAQMQPLEGKVLEEEEA